MGIWAIVVAAGNGTRFGGLKQMEMLGGKRVIDWSCDAVKSVAEGVVVVTNAHLVDDLRSTLTSARDVVVGGQTRSESVRAGIAALPSGVEVIVVHDAARPFATGSLFETVVQAVRNGFDAAIPGIAVTDTIKRVDAASVVLETVDRTELVVVQTPQAFRPDMLARAHQGRPDASDDAALVEMLGGKVVVVPGDKSNIKITTPDDLEAARSLVEST